jgi:two-component system NtrC family sensor kinase
MMTKNNQNDAGRENRVRKTILTNMIVVPFIPFLMAMGVSFYYFATTLEHNTVSSLKRIVEDHRDMIESFLVERQADLELITNTYRFEDIEAPEAIDGIFATLKTRSGAFVDLGLFDAQGIHVGYSGPYELRGKNYKEEPWFIEVMNSGYHISDIFLGYRNVPHFVIAVRQGIGEASWVLRATIDTQIFDRLVSQVKIGSTGEAYILNTQGIAQTGRRSGGVVLMEKDLAHDNFPSAPDETRAFIQKDREGTRYLYSTTGLKNNDWILVARQETKDAYRTLYSALYICLLIVVVGGAVIVAMAVYITGRIVRKLEALGHEKKALGNQLIRATQLAEIGEMATGFAHEINNPLQIIKSEHALIMSLLEDMATAIDFETIKEMNDLMDSLDQIQLQVNRCSKITHAILKYGRKNEIERRRLEPSEVIPEIIQMIEKKASVSGIEIVRDFAEDAPCFIGDPAQFQQVLLNFINNAMDAIGERHGVSGGILTLRTRKKEDGQLAVDISDNGTGISPENMGKIFSPFFTTKPVGKGTGLGLSVCFGIIGNFGGTIEVASEPNVGTTFTITLPADTER